MDKVKVYGCSDDLVEIENDKNFDEIDCWNNKVTIWFTDGTVIEVKYGKDHKGIWEIKEIQGGNAPRTLTPCDDEDAEIYSDIFEIDAEVEDVAVGEVHEQERELVMIFRDLKRKYPLEYIQSAYEEVIGL